MSSNRISLVQVLIDRVYPHMSEITAGFLLKCVVLDAERLMPGVAEITAGRIAASRLGFAGALIMSELENAPECSFDTYTGHIVVWPVIDRVAPVARQAKAWASRLEEIGASWLPELASRLRRRLKGECSEAFAGLKRRTSRSVPPPALPDTLGPSMRQLKLLERKLRAEFDVRDLGDQITADERARILHVMAFSFRADDIARALRGRAGACRRQRRWEDIDTAEHFLRISWLCSRLDRLQAALSEKLVSVCDEGAVVEGRDGRRFVAGMEIVDLPPAYDEQPAGDDSTLDMLRNVVRKP